MRASNTVLLALRVGSIAAFVVLIAILPRFLSDFRATEFARVAIFFTALVGLNILTGYTGQISLGHGAFMALGGYTSALLISGRPGLELAGLDPPGWIPLGDGMQDVWTIPIAALVTGLFGMNVGVPGEGDIGAFWAIVGAMFAVLVSMVAYFRHRGWL